MSKFRKGSKKNNSIFRWLYIVLFSLVVIWLLSAIILGKSPTEVLSSAFSKIPNPTAQAITLEVEKKDSTIVALQEQLDKCMGSGGLKRGLVIIDSPTLNMRNEPSLSAGVEMRIPANSEVRILFYDTETYYLEGIAGKWVKIKYAGTEGWVWGNFIREI